ncbi:hypothetical protein B0H14DRAFT_3510699 [Mycena olivaceomarginata]|nr:hypothetical protein B0H14DRAFT_3510699 [Mycena olivaceomarginata]
MLVGRPPLDPDIRDARRQESRRRYEAKNLAARRERAQVRMAKQVQPYAHPALLIPSRHRTKIGEMTAKERRRHRERAAEDSREAELRAQEHQATVRHKKKVLATNDVRRAHGLPDIPVAPRHPCFPRQDLSSHRRAALPAAGSHLDDGALSGDTTSSRHCTRAATPPIYEGGITARTRTVAPRVCPKCECEGCPGCMCMCPVSTEWIEHADGEAHFFPTCIDAPPYETGVLLCTPVYAPDPGHEDQDTHTGGYFAVVHDDWKGVVTSQVAGARSEALPRRSHLHRVHVVEHNAFLVAENARIETEDKARIKRQEELAYLATTKPPLVPLSPQCARLQFERVLGLGAGAGAPPFHNVPDLPIVALPPPAIPVLPGRPKDLAAMDGNSHLKHTRHRDVAATATLPPGYSDFELGPNAPRLFAVSGHSRVFRNRDRAVAVLQQTPGAELFWSCNPQEVWQFIAETHVGLK